MKNENLNNNIENKKWDDIMESFKKSQDYKDCTYQYLYQVFIRWLKHNYAPPTNLHIEENNSVANENVFNAENYLK